MSKIWPEIAEAWSQVGELSVFFWLFSLIATFLLSSVYALMVAVSPLQPNKQSPWDLFPILWLSLETMAIFIACKINIFLYVAAGLFILYGFLVQLLNHQIPRD